MKKQPEITEQTKANLKEAFWELYISAPIEKISIKQITDRAGYNRGTFYLYYKDVYDILAQIEEEVLSEARSFIETKLEQDIAGNLTEYMSILVEMNHAYARYMAVLLGDSGDPLFRSRFKAYLKPLCRRFLLPDKPLSETEAELLLEYYLSGLLALVTKWLSQPEAMPIEQFLLFAIEHILP